MIVGGRMHLDFTIFIAVIFFSGKRKHPPCLSNGKYFPHLVVKGDDEYLGVNIIDGSNCFFNEISQATVIPIYEGVNYAKLKIGTPFFVMEGGNIVGEGMVKDIYQHQSIKQRGFIK